MAVEDSIETAPDQPGVDRPTAAEAIEQLTQFDGPPEQFLVNLLAVQCYIGGAQAGTILRPTPQGQIEVLSLFPALPENSTAPPWLGQCVEWAGGVLSAGRTATKGLRTANALYGQPSRQHAIMLPIRTAGGGVRGLAAFVIDSYDPRVLGASRERLELTICMLSMYEMRLTLQRRQMDLRRLRLAMDTLSAVNEQNRFAGAAMAICNEITARWSADRVGLGLLKGRYVKLKALSHTEKFSRKMKMIQDIEAAMEECIDQDVEVLYPPPAEATFVSRATGELCKRHGPTTTLSLPLRHNGEAIAVLTVQRPVEKPFTLEEAESLRLACDLCSPRVAVLQEHDRWFGAKLAGGARKGLGFVVGAKHTWIKVAAVAVVAGLLFITLAKGSYQAEAPFVIEAAERQVISAPFDAKIESVTEVRPGFPVSEGTELASLNTDDLRSQLNSAQARQNSKRIEAGAYQASGETAKQKIAEAEADEVAAQIEMLNHRIAQAKIVSPIAGHLLTGDLSQALSRVVRTGEQLFEVAPLDALWADLSVPEDQMADVREGQTGELATAMHPEQRIKFVVERINPVAETVNQQNIFKVRVRLTGSSPSRLLPGTEGVAKIDLGPKRYAWLWSRRLVNWLRMKLWLDI